MRRTITTAETVEKFKKVHGVTYDYSKVVYISAKDKVEIICKEHGSFWQAPTNHLAGTGCRECGLTRCPVTKPSTKDVFVDKAVTIHSGKYGYDLVVYKTSGVKVEITCKEHGNFWQTPNNHISKKHGCPVCSVIRVSSKQTYTTKEFIKRAVEVHGDKYDYSETEYVDSRKKVKIKCLTHNLYFYQPPNGHLGGIGCALCGFDRSSESCALTREQFINRCKDNLNHSTIIYDGLEYCGVKQLAKFKCSVHGEFWQLADNHLRGASCPKCSHKISTGETSIRKFIENLGIACVCNNRKLLNGKELDIYIPEFNIALEYNGCFWHSEHPQAKGANARMHLLEKQEMCRKIGISLLHIMDTDNEEVIKRLLLSRLGRVERIIGARKCRINKSPDKSLVKDFYTTNHIQGWAAGCCNYTLEYDGEIVACMSFSSINSERGRKKDAAFQELRRFATSCRVPGAASKLLKAFITDHLTCKEIVSYSDNRLFSGGMYGKLGFSLVGSSAPSYKYFSGNSLVPKANFKRSRLARMVGFDFVEEETEVQNCNRNGWWRVWDCGKKKWLLKL